MKKTLFNFCLVLFTLSIVVGCGEKDLDSVARIGAVYEPTTKVDFIFHPSQAPATCRVFAELIFTVPARETAKQMHDKLLAEAMARGVDIVLIGQSRQMKDDAEYAFIYVGPEREYSCRAGWHGWGHGYEIWKDHGGFVSIGFKEWESPDLIFDFPVLVKTVFLRCQ
jgi:hypothetical protein